MSRALFFFFLYPGGLAALLLLGLGCNLSGIDGSGNENENEKYPECKAFIDSYKDLDGSACEEELDCNAYDSAQACADVPPVSGAQGLQVACHWGQRFVGNYGGEMCSGEVDEVCVAAVLIGEGGPPCAGYFEELPEGVEVLDLSCAMPISSDYSECFATPYEDGICTCAGV